MPGYEPKPSDVLERFLRYVQVDSQSDPHNEDETPSTARQHDIARLLADELAALGCEDVTLTDHAYVTASLPASVGAEGLPALGLIAHMDTAPDAPASGVRPHIVHYEGGELVSPPPLSCRTPASRWRSCPTRRSATARRCSTWTRSAPRGPTPWTARSSASSTGSASRPARLP